MKDLKSVGGVLMILGTSIGGGLLALPVVTAHEGFATTVVLLVSVWMMMTFAAYLLLEATLWLPEGTNIISMSGFTLGKPGQIASWLCYLLLLYALLSAYISGNSDILQGLLGALHINIYEWFSAIIITILFGSIVYRGIYSVDIVNRLLMGGKLLFYLLLVGTIAPHVNINHLCSPLSKNITIDTIMVMVTSFGFAIIIPSLRTYFGSDVKKLKLVLLFGTMLPLIFYIVWVCVINGLLTTQDLNYLAAAPNTITALTNVLYSNLNSTWLITFIRCFTSICAATSFLGVALSFCDFLADGTKTDKTTKQGAWIYFAVFVPPLLLVMLFPNVFVAALSYAGIFCLILSALLPALMAWSGRYVQGTETSYTVCGGKTLLAIQIIACLGLLGWSIGKHF